VHVVHELVQQVCRQAKKHSKNTRHVFAAQGDLDGISDGRSDGSRQALTVELLEQCCISNKGMVASSIHLVSMLCN
jgi:hypothetical protein